ncbi:uncharacterized protein LOC143852861 isoform X2 [Tasmannia lanceolata]|uniref:uncharacterized protein LOC143852861 isoform X2 n=1 Tax=Tasmannia lanceolata TaxID=3420 RepID=UPI0040632C17
MQWYCSTESEDRLVPKVQESSDMLCEDYRSPSPDDWVQWGVTRPEKFGLPNKFNFGEMIPNTEEFTFGRQSLYLKSKKKHSALEGEGSSNSSDYEDFSLIDYKQANGVLNDRPDYQLQNLYQSVDYLGSMEQMNDIFLHSFLEEDPSQMENLYRPVGMFQESECSSMSFEDLNDMVIDPRHTMKDPFYMSNSKYLKTSHFSLAIDGVSDNWDQKEDSSSSDVIRAESGMKEGSHTIKFPVVTQLNPSKKNESSETGAHVGEGKSLEASVLQDLESVMTQLNESTRICFRDALFRLAKSSRQQHAVNESRTSKFTVDKPSLGVVHTEKHRFDEMKSVEAETNVIDRTVANLIFNKPDCSPPDLSCLSSIQLSKEALMGSGLCNYSLKQPLPMNLSCDDIISQQSSDIGLSTHDSDLSGYNLPVGSTGISDQFNMTSN